MKRYALILTGELLPHAKRHEAVSSLAELLRLSLAQADALLNGKPKPLKGLVTRLKAEDAKTRFEEAGIGCEIREEVEADPAPAAMAFEQPPDLDVDSTSVRCPKCAEVQPPAETCRQCGVVFAKFTHAHQEMEAAKACISSVKEVERFPYRLVNRLLLLFFLTSLGLAVWSHWKKAQLPPPDFYDLQRLVEPRQNSTATQPFHLQSHGIDYKIEPEFDYELDGVVVSLHDSDVFWDIYHTKDWQDFINIRDLCVVWGNNVASGVFRDMHYENTTWTCWVSSHDEASAKRFASDQLSNNHLLTNDPYLQEVIKSAEVGDQIYFRGQLAKYSHAGGFERGTSTTRTDTGNGACETVYVEDFQITRKSNRGWRLLYRVASNLSVLSFVGLAILFFVAPYRHSE